MDRCETWRGVRQMERGEDDTERWRERKRSVVLWGREWLVVER